METMQEFVTTLKSGIENVIPDDLKDSLEITDTVTTKVNDRKLSGLSIRQKGNESAPSFYVDQLYQRYQDGETIEALAAELTAEYLRTLPLQENPIISSDLSYEHIKNHLALKLLEISRNQDYLSQIPYLAVGNGLALVCDIQFPAADHDGVWRTTVTDQMVETQHYDMSEVFRQALLIAERVDPPTLVGVNAKLFDPAGNTNLLDAGPLKDTDKDMIYVLSNQTGAYGAAAFFYPGIQERIAKKLNENYYAIPSSLHEYLIMPESNGVDPRDLAEMVKVANQTVVETKDVLSDTALHYNCDTKQLEAITYTVNTNEQS